MKTDIISQMNAEKSDNVLSDLERKRICCLCNWTNVNLINLGEQGKPRWVCHGCCKTTLESRDQLRAELDKEKVRGDEYGQKYAKTMLSRDQWRAEADRLQIACDKYSNDEIVGVNIRNDRDQWRAVADELADRLNGYWSNHGNTIEQVKSALAAYEKLKGTK